MSLTLVCLDVYISDLFILPTNLLIIILTNLYTEWIHILGFEWWRTFVVECVSMFKQTYNQNFVWNALFIVSWYDQPHYYLLFNHPSQTYITSRQSRKLKLKEKPLLIFTKHKPIMTLVGLGWLVILIHNSMCSNPQTIELSF